MRKINNIMKKLNNYLKMIFAGVRMDPLICIEIAMLIMLLGYFISGWFILFIITILLIPIFISGVFFHRNYVTLCFYSLHFRNWNYIYQKRRMKCGKKKRSIELCEKILDYEKKNLLANLPAGRYATITHEYVIKKLWGAENVILLRCTPAYNKSLISIQNNMFGCKKCQFKCRHCTNCFIRNEGNESKQFYYIKFVKTHATINNA